MRKAYRRKADMFLLAIAAAALAVFALIVGVGYEFPAKPASLNRPGTAQLRSAS